MILRNNRHIIKDLSRYDCLKNLVDNVFPDKYHITSKSFASLDDFKFPYASSNEVILFHNTGYSKNVERHKYEIITIEDLTIHKNYPWMSDISLCDNDFVYPYKFIKILMYYLLGEPNKVFDLATPIWGYTEFLNILDSFYTHQSISEDRSKCNDQLMVIYKKKVSEVLFSEYDRWHNILNASWMNTHIHLTEKEFLDTIMNEKYIIYRENDSDPNSEIECISDWNNVFNPRTWSLYHSTIQTCTWEVKPDEILGIGYLSNDGYDSFFEKPGSNINKHIRSNIERYKLTHQSE